MLASGDPGFFGIVRALVARGAAPDVIPATSSVALAFARLGLPWDDALVLSAHGRDARPVLAAALGCGKAAILTAPGPTAGPQRFIPALLAAGRPVYVAECLGAPDERLTRVTAGPMREFADPNLVIALDTPGHGGAYGAALASGSIGAAVGGSGEGVRCRRRTWRRRQQQCTRRERRRTGRARCAGQARVGLLSWRPALDGRSSGGARRAGPSQRTPSPTVTQ